MILIVADVGRRRRLGAPFIGKAARLLLIAEAARENAAGRHSGEYMRERYREPKNFGQRHAACVTLSAAKAEAPNSHRMKKEREVLIALFSASLKPLERLCARACLRFLPRKRTT